jgi:uncharacterized protein
MDITHKIATHLKVADKQVAAAIALLDDGSTVPFISRYRKEVTGGLDDTQLRDLEQKLNYLRELEDRRQTILSSITEQEKLTPALHSAIMAAEDKATLEDLYLPYKPRRRTKAQIAIEAGLAPLAEQLFADPSLDPKSLAEKFLNPEHQINDIDAALEGARQILMEQFSEHAELVGSLREFVWKYSVVESTVAKGKEVEGKKFTDYFEYKEPLNKIPSHRALALFRGRAENILRLSLTLTEDQEADCVARVAGTFNIKMQNRPADAWLYETAQKAWRLKLQLHLELDLMTRLRQTAEEEAIHVFADNLKHLLMAAPAGNRVTMGLDPGLRTGVKVVVIDGTGKLLTYTTIFPHVPREDWNGSLASLAKLAQEFNVDLVSIGNGTGSRETDKLVSELMKKLPKLNLTQVIVSEAGASVYSASELAAKEFPALDVTYRGAVSIARRLQDPLAELIKIDPKAIGVGQYQHDVNQTKLGSSLQTVLEDCVNAVGVDLNTASAPLLASVAGLNETLAKKIITYRDENGRFKNRMSIKKVPGLGDKRFQQAAGFLRITQGDNPLDASAVHPEAYPVVERILAQHNKTLRDIMGNSALLRALKPSDFTDDTFGIPTITDIIGELDKPGRDPRPEFKTATFKEGIEKVSDLRAGMVLEGVVTNVANFGAFVDIGVHQDGLIHVSQLANQFVKDPKEVIKVGEIVTVKVLEIDIPRQRISLTRRLEEKTEKAPAPVAKQHRPTKPTTQQPPNAMASALLAALKK